MESPDRKTPAPSAAATRPSLLGADPSGAGSKGSAPSMLGSLERGGKAAGSPSAGGQSGRPKVVAAAFVALLLVGVGAWVGLRPAADAGRSVSTSLGASSANGSTAARQQPGSSGAALANLNSASAPPAGAASAPVAVAQIESAAVAVPEVPPKLATSDGKDAPAASAPGPATPAKKNRAPEAAARTKSAAASTAVKAGAARGTDGAPARPAAKGEVDPDTELVAAIIARLDRRGAQPSSAAASAANEQNLLLATRLQACESKSTKNDPLELRRCRNRVCENKWGRVDACPASRAPKGANNVRSDHGTPG